MAETDNNRYSCSKRVNTPKLVHLSSFTPIGTTVIELREFKKKKNMDKMGKLLLAIIFTFGVFYFVC